MKIISALGLCALFLLSGQSLRAQHVDSLDIRMSKPTGTTDHFKQLTIEGCWIAGKYIPLETSGLVASSPQGTFRHNVLSIKDDLKSTEIEIILTNPKGVSQKTRLSTNRKTDLDQAFLRRMRF